MRKKGDFFVLLKYTDNGIPLERRLTYLTEEELNDQIVVPYNSRHSIMLPERAVTFASICGIRIFRAFGKFKDGVMRSIKELNDIKQMIDEEDGEHFKEVTSLFLKTSYEPVVPESPSVSQRTAEAPPPIPMQNFSATRIFVVHGRDDAMKESVARVIEKLKLEAVILHEQPELGRTIIEKFTQCSDVGYALVLLSPDDFAYPKDLTPEKGMYRARQNVILELGYFIGKLGRGRVMALNNGGSNFEIPTDFAGVVYTPFDEQWRFKLVKELRACGYNVSADQLL